MGLYRDAKNYLSRALEPAEPNTFVEGGGNLDQDRFQRTGRDRDRLEQYEQAYRQGGPVSSLIDTRALMTFGTGAEFVSDDDQTAQTRDGEFTVAEWLASQFDDLDNLLIRLGRDAYIYGDSFGDIVETQAGGFSHVALVNPKTLEPRWNEKGAIDHWIQTIERDGLQRDIEQRFDPEDIAHVKLHQLGRHPLGVSLIGRNWHEVKRFAKNQHAIANALQSHAFTKWQVKAGKEDGPAIDDNELRRVRQRFNDVKNNDTYVTGVDIDIQELDTGGLGEGITNITENDLTNLAAGFGVPEEMAGLGRGSTEATAKVRLQAFERTARAEQRALADRFLEEVIRPVLDEYSPFPRDVDVQLTFGDVVSDQQATAEWLRDFKGIYTADEMREKLGDGAIPDDVSDDDLGVPGDEGETSSGGMGDLFASSVEDGGAGNGQRAMTDGDGASYQDWEQAFHDVIDHALWSEDSTRSLFGFDDTDVPEFAKQRLREAVLSDAFFSDFDSVPSGARETLRESLLDSIADGHGWSLDSITNNLQDTVPDLEDHEAERIARTETQAVVNDARERGYEERLDLEEERFDWVGPDDNRNSDACPWIKSQIPEEGVRLERLKELIQEANSRFVDHAAREYTPHIQCRHQYVRRVS